MIEEKLEITIPTFNRSPYLNNLLSNLLKSPFVNCKITIYDNCSPDETPKICEKYEKLFPNLKIVRNKENIGGDANIMKSLETPQTSYGWVIADDDIFDFSDCDDLIEAIESEKYYIILTCSSGFPNHKGKTINEVLKKYNDSKNNYLENDTLTLIKALKENYFFTMGTISAPIYKTDIWDSQALMEGYNNISNMHPHYPLILKSIENNYLTYKTKSEIIQVSDNDNKWEKSLLTWIIGWLNSASLIKNKEIKKIASQFLEGGPIIVSMWNIIAAKSLNEKDLKTKVISLNSVIIKLNGWFKGIAYSILLILTYLIPKKICKIIYNSYKN